MEISFSVAIIARQFLYGPNVSVEVTETDTCVAQLLDSGNLILVQEMSKRVVWESFDHPTDTHLPGMKLGLNRKTGIHQFLTSWRSADDPGTGDYSLQVNPKGSPQVILYRDEISISFSLVDASVVLRTVLDYSGLLMRLTWHEREGKWKEFWSAPDYQCGSYGQCGAYSKCDPLYVNRKFECDCLPGYKPKFLRDWNTLKDGSGGCVRKRQESMCMRGEGFVKVAGVRIPDTSEAVWLGLNMSPVDCELVCRRNCSCSAYARLAITGKGTGCLAWYGELMDTVIIMDEGFDIHVRVDTHELAEIAEKSNGFLERKDNPAILIVSVVSAWFIIILFACLWFKKKGKRVRKKWKERLLDTIDGKYCKDILVANEVGGHPEVAFFNLSTILAATNSFSPAKILGQGGFGLVYKGQLSNGQEIAVKRLSKNSGQGIEEFKNEVMLIAKLQHKNLVKLIGCCIQGEEPMLVYEYLSNKSLDSILFDETKRGILDWSKRFGIIVGIARGILYIHQDSSGYMSPEYVIFGKFSTKSDVFSFGVILLEIITGKKNNSYYQEDSHLTMIGHIWHSWRENRPLEIVDSSLRESCSPHEVLRCIQIGFLCVQEDELDRPTMSTVVLMLNSETALPPPKQPAFILRKSYNSSSSSAKRDEFYSVDDKTITEIVCR
ncbi:hypothetical protein GH714_000019 [Hevea brasiliensis]|uniref:non-specific serine/threonine protein kinase n=1 Tax=Hevea brasiliensis TaxID=3981 RepID=A0A6A6M983_HEVBR|nr:hypothetical protein GH714_000019 [Hevea brasiliensis]